MPYLRASRYRAARPALGFTPEQETQLLATEADEGKKLDEILTILRRQDQLRMIAVVAEIGGLLFTLAKMGEFVSSLRARRKVAP